MKRRHNRIYIDFRVPFPGSVRAFDEAIGRGRLSTDKLVANYAGNYMYMGKAKNGGDAFKHTQTRRYID